MFLLKYNSSSNLFNVFTFTIQNVPIKRRVTIDNAIVITDLQYKMFLLNSNENGSRYDENSIYNTKCSY